MGFQPGQEVRIARSAKKSFQAHAMERIGKVVRIRNDGLVVVLWSNLLSPQVYHSDLLEPFAASKEG